MSLEDVRRQIGGAAYQVGRVRLENAFVIDRSPVRLLYVRPDYTRYRLTALKVFPNQKWPVDFDHALGRRMASTLGYPFVLLLRVKPRVNRAHGRFETNARLRGDCPTLCYADDRILDKWIGRGPNFWRTHDPSMGFDPGHPGKLGLTLKQMGWWGFAMGVEDLDRPLTDLRPVEV